MTIAEWLVLQEQYNTEHAQRDDDQDDDDDDNEQDDNRIRINAEIHHN